MFSCTILELARSVIDFGDSASQLSAASTDYVGLRTLTIIRNLEGVAPNKGQSYQSVCSLGLRVCRYFLHKLISIASLGLFKTRHRNDKTSCQ